jgi:hypothetical protein
MQQYGWSDAETVYNFDAELNKLMIRLGLYEITNPESEDFDLNAAMKYIDNKR